MRWLSYPLICWCVLCGLLASCGKGLPEPYRVVAENQVFYSDESKLVEVGGTAIRTRAAWRDYWAQVTGTESTPPSVDFGSQMLLAFNAGRMRPGDRIQILELQSLEDELVAWFRIDECGTLQSEVYPIQVVRVEKREGPVRFERRTSLDPFCR